MEWKFVHLKDICLLINGRAFKTTEWSTVGLPIIRIQNLNSPYAEFNYFDGSYDEKHFIKNGDLLFAWSGTPGTSFGAHVWNGGDALLNQHIFKIDFDKRFITQSFFLYTLKFKIDELIAQAQGGVGLRHITKSKFEILKIDLPTLAEQKEIVRIIESHLQLVDQIKSRLDALPKILEQFRQSVLASAVSGKLTEDWRVQNKVLYAEWSVFYLKELGDLFRGRSKHRPRNDPKLFGGKYPFLQTGDISNSNGRINSASKFYSNFGMEQSRVFPKNTLCITIAANIADTAILDIEACFPDSIVGFSPNDEKCCVDFIKYYIDDNKNNLEEIAPATAQKNINLKILNELRVNLPLLKEQIEIVKRVESLFALADQIESKIKHAQERVNLLTQSILAKAFRGEFTAKWREDNPDLISGENSAEALLKRIEEAKKGAKKTR